MFQFCKFAIFVLKIIIIKMQKQKKYSSPYSIVKTPTEQSQFHNIYNTHNKNTRLLWLAKVIDNQRIQRYNLEQPIQYNVDALCQLKQKRNVIYVEEVFEKDGKLFFIEEKYEVRLDKYLMEKGTLQPDQVVRIMQEVFMGVCDIYEEEYFIRSIRPQQIVKFDIDDEQDPKYKIETLVFDNKQYQTTNAYTWKHQYASYEEKNLKDSLDEQKLDGQLVWNFGILAVHLLMGDQIFKKALENDEQIQWDILRKITQQTPELFELIQKCYRVKYEDRIELKKLFTLKIFEDLYREGITDFFLTSSKIFKNNQGLSSLPKRSMMINKIGSNSMSQNLSFVIKKKNLCLVNDKIMKQYEKGAFLMKIQEFKGTLQVLKQDQLVMCLSFYKHCQNLVKEIRQQFKFNDKAGQKQKKFEQKLKTLQKNVKTEIQKINKELSRNPIKKFIQKKNLSVQQLLQPKLQKQKTIKYLNVCAGRAYSQLRSQKSSQENQKFMAFCIFAVTLSNFQERNSLDQTMDVYKSQNYSEIFQNGHLEQLTKISQNLLKQHFTIK